MTSRDFIGAIQIIIINKYLRTSPIYTQNMPNCVPKKKTITIFFITILINLTFFYRYIGLSFRKSWLFIGRTVLGYGHFAQHIWLFCWFVPSEKVVDHNPGASILQLRRLFGPDSLHDDRSVFAESHWQHHMHYHCGGLGCIRLVWFCVSILFQKSHRQLTNYFLVAFIAGSIIWTLRHSMPVC